MHKQSSFPSSKIAVIGTGAVGSTVAYVATIKNLAAEIALIDVEEEKEAGHVMDIADGLCFVETGCVKGEDFRDAAGADVIVVTAGVAQKAAGAESRLELVKTNKKILASIFKKIGRIKKTAVVIIVSNPVDVLTYVAQKISGLPVGQVFGSGTALDSSRLKTELSDYFGVNAQDVHGYVLGEHGDSEFIPWSAVTIGGMPATKLKGFTASVANRVEERVKREAYEIIKLKGATYFGIALAVSDIIEAVFYNQHRILPVSSRIMNWNGVSNVCLGAPAVIGRSGVERLWPLTLTAGEKAKLKKSAAVIKKYL